MVIFEESVPESDLNFCAKHLQLVWGLELRNLESKICGINKPSKTWLISGSAFKMDILLAAQYSLSYN